MEILRHGKGSIIVRTLDSIQFLQFFLVLLPCRHTEHSVQCTVPRLCQPIFAFLACTLGKDISPEGGGGRGGGVMVAGKAREGGARGRMATEEWVTETKDREMLTKHKQKI